MNNIRSIENLTEQETKLGIFGGVTKGSWHDTYKSSAWVYLGGFSYELSEGDVICVMSQWGEIEDIHLVREKETNKSKGFAFVKYEDQRSTILAVDNFNGIKLLGRSLRCDHVDQYKLPKEIKDKEIEALQENPDHKIKLGPGHAYRGKELENAFNIEQGVNIWAPPSATSSTNPVTADPKSSDHKRKHNDSEDDSKSSSESDSDSNSDNSTNKKKHSKKHKKHHHKKEDNDDNKKKKRDSSEKDHKKHKKEKHRDHHGKEKKEHKKAVKEKVQFTQDYVSRIANRFELAPGSNPTTSTISTYALPEGMFLMIVA